MSATDCRLHGMRVCNIVCVHLAAAVIANRVERGRFFVDDDGAHLLCDRCLTQATEQYRDPSLPAGEDYLQLDDGLCPVCDLCLHAWYAQTGQGDYSAAATLARKVPWVPNRLPAHRATRQPLKPRRLEQPQDRLGMSRCAVHGEVWVYPICSHIGDAIEAGRLERAMIFGDNLRNHIFCERCHRVASTQRRDPSLHSTEDYVRLDQPLECFCDTCVRAWYAATGQGDLLAALKVARATPWVPNRG